MPVCSARRFRGWLGRQGSNLGWRDQNPLPYHLATPQDRRAGFYRVRIGAATHWRRAAMAALRLATLHPRRYNPRALAERSAAW